MAQDPLHLLCVEPRFPGRLGAVADWLVRKRGYRCRFFCHAADPQPFWPESAGKGLDVIQFGVGGVAREAAVPWPRYLERGLCYAYGCWEVVHARRPQPVDVVLGRSAGLGSTLFTPVSLPRVPVVNLFDYFQHAHAHDLADEAGPETPAEYFHWRRSANAMDLLDLENGVTPWVPARWQRDLYPAEYRGDFVVLYDGVDVRRFARRAGPDAARTIAGRALPPQARVVTFVARGLESMRGFDLFMDVARRIAAARPDVLFVVVGQEESYYSWDLLHTGRRSFKEWVLSRGNYDLSRFLFLRHLEPEQLADLLSLSDLHVYLTVPFVLSWSLLNALACGCVVLASDVPPVREVIEPGKNGLIGALFDADQLAETALRVLADPATYLPLGRVARDRVEEKYSLEVAVPDLKAYFERMASARTAGV
jgi:glycosyltransferase involved in cell wall biosynthesis